MKGMLKLRCIAKKGWSKQLVIRPQGSSYSYHIPPFDNLFSKLSHIFYSIVANKLDFNWQGKMYGTNESTIFVTAGGYNCQHSIMPVSVFAVPKADIERNIKNGNFEPSAVEQRLLNE